MQLVASLFFLILSSLAVANVEKTIFLAPEAISIRPYLPNLDHLRLNVLNPSTASRSSITTQLKASFPTSTSLKGTESWFLLEDLSPKQRYEIRVCWIATQPTSFSLYTYSLPEVFDNSSLVASLATFAERRQDPEVGEFVKPPVQTSAYKASVLFLQVFAAADYFTTNHSLMQNVPLVDVDVILDPFLGNIFPRSLLPTAAHIILITIVAWFISSEALRILQRIAESSDRQQSLKQKTA